jgi:hypothetical protein
MLEVFKALAEYGVEMDMNRNKFVPDGYVSIWFSKGNYRRAYIYDYSDDRFRDGAYSHEEMLIDLIKRFADECDELVEKED